MTDLARRPRVFTRSLSVGNEAHPRSIRVFTLGRFEISLGGRPLRFLGKVQRKPLALLRVIIALGGRCVSEARVVEALWPDAEGDAGRLSLSTAVHRLRGILRRKQVIIRQDDQVGLDARYCWVDVWAMEQILGRAELAFGRCTADDAGWNNTVRCTDQAVRLYRGPFLGDESGPTWAAPLADRLRRRLLRQLVQVGRRWEERRDWQPAADCYDVALHVDPGAEDVYRRLMIASHHLGRPAEVQRIYQRCREALLGRIGVNPSPETDVLLSRLRAP